MIQLSTLWFATVSLTSMLTIIQCEPTYGGSDKPYVGEVVSNTGEVRRGCGVADLEQAEVLRIEQVTRNILKSKQNN